MSNTPNPDNTEPQRILSIIFFKWNEDSPIKLSATYELSSYPFLQRSYIKDSILLGCRWIARQTLPGTRQAINFQDNLVLCCSHTTNSGLCANVITSPSYPSRVAFGLLNEAQKEFSKAYDGLWQTKTEDVPENLMFAKMGTELLNKYKNPSDADTILRLQNELDEVKNIMIQNIDDLFKRGKQIEDIRDKADYLTKSAEEMLRQARKANQCCKWY